jgi:hypothetical protein
MFFNPKILNALSIVTIIIGLGKIALIHAENDWIVRLGNGRYEKQKFTKHYSVSLWT